MDAVRESSQELMTQLVQVLLDEGVTAQTLDLDAMPFEAMEQLGHGLGKVLAQQIQLALAAPQPRMMQTLDGAVEFREPKCVRAAGRKPFFRQRDI